MDLWIRSQDKECLMRIVRLDIEFDKDAYQIIEGSFRTALASYQTKERALQVLDEISDFKDALNILELTDKRNAVKIIEECIKKSKSFIYQMPEE